MERYCLSQGQSLYKRIRIGWVQVEIDSEAISIYRKQRPTLCYPIKKSTSNSAECELQITSEKHENFEDDIIQSQNRILCYELCPIQRNVLDTILLLMSRDTDRANTILCQITYRLESCSLNFSTNPPPPTIPAPTRIFTKNRHVHPHGQLIRDVIINETGSTNYGIFTLHKVVLKAQTSLIRQKFITYMGNAEIYSIHEKYTLDPTTPHLLCFFPIIPITPVVTIYQIVIISCCGRSTICIFK